MVAAVGCTTTRSAGDEYYGNDRAYLNDPYRGTVVLERDPFTGRYYEVGTYGSYYGNVYSNRRYYGRNYNNGYRKDYNRKDYNDNNRRYQTPPPAQEQPQDREKARNEARKKILGN